MTENEIREEAMEEAMEAREHARRQAREAREHARRQAREHARRLTTESGAGFIKHWIVTHSAGDNDMPQGQKFRIVQHGTFYRIVAESTPGPGRKKMASDWQSTDFKLRNPSDLEAFFTKDKTTWDIVLSSDGKTLTAGIHSRLMEQAGTWEANEETG